MDWQEDLRVSSIEAKWNKQKVLKDIKERHGEDIVVVEEKYFIERMNFIFNNKIWDGSKFPWSKTDTEMEWKWLLVELFPDHVATWWDKSKFSSYSDWDIGVSIVEFCNDNLSVWWDKDLVDWKNETHLLCEHCANDIDKWFDENTFDYAFSLYLFTYAIDYSHLWMDGYKKELNSGDIEISDLVSNYVG